MIPQTGEVLAMYSSPAIDPNRFVGGVSAAYYDSLLHDPRKPLYNKVLQSKQPPGSTFKLATSVMALQDSLITFDSHMPQSCNGYYYFGNRTWHCWRKEGHGSLNLTGAIAQSCDVYFYQLGLKLTLSRIVAGGVRPGFRQAQRASICPKRHVLIFRRDATTYFNKKYRRGGLDARRDGAEPGDRPGRQLADRFSTWRSFYSALATDGNVPVPMIKQRRAETRREA